MAWTKLTMLNSMASPDFGQALHRHKAWGLTELDLKDAIFGKPLLALSDEEANRAAEMIQQAGMHVWCLSTQLFHRDVEHGRDAFADDAGPGVKRAVELARLFRPRFVRLLAAWTSRRADVLDSATYLRHQHPWLFGAYRAAVERLVGAGFAVTIENEIGGCIWSRPEEILGFFDELDQPVSRVCYTYDVQNLWQCGTFPSVAAYKALRPITGYLHLKGGQCDLAGGPLVWRSALADASWPVIDIVRQAVTDRVSPVICLNPSHGKPKPDYDYTAVIERDLAFLRREVPGIR